MQKSTLSFCTSKGSCAGRLEGIEQHVCADAVRLLHDGFDILNESAAKDHVRDGDDQRFVVDGVEQALGVDVDAVIVGHHLDACAARTLRLPEVHYRRKIQVGIDHFVAAAAEVEARGHGRLAGGDVLQAGDRSLGSVEQRADLVADLGGQHPPFFFPGANAARVPDVGVLLQRIFDAAGHCPQRIADEVGGAAREWGTRGGSAEVRQT